MKLKSFVKLSVTLSLLGQRAPNNTASPVAAPFMGAPSQRRLKPAATVLLTALTLCLLAPLSAMVVGAESTAQPPKPAPQFVLKDLSGKAVKLSDFDGKALLVVFWLTRSGPCQEQIKSLIELQQQYADKQFTVLGFCLNDKGSAAVKAFVDERKINFPVLIADYKTVQDFGGITAVPTLFVIEKNHHIIQKYVGLTPKTKLENDLKPILER